MNSISDFPFFITGTDTGIGKTWATLALMQALQNSGQRVAGMKPIASGCAMTPQGLRNPDALLIQQQASFAAPYALVNPYAFAPPIAPHIAAVQSGLPIDLPVIRAAAQALQMQADGLVIEGVGGWRVPLSASSSLVDLVKCLKAQVILVVGLRLGCLNHALLTAEVMAADGCACVGWIANPLAAEVVVGEQLLATLRQRLPMPLLGCLPYQETLQVAALAQALEIRRIRCA